MENASRSRTADLATDMAERIFDLSVDRGGGRSGAGPRGDMTSRSALTRRCDRSLEQVRETHFRRGLMQVVDLQCIPADGQ